MAKINSTENGLQIECGKCSSFHLADSCCSYFDEKLPWDSSRWKFCPGYELYDDGVRKNYKKGCVDVSKRQPIDLPKEGLKNLEEPVQEETEQKTPDTEPVIDETAEEPEVEEAPQVEAIPPKPVECILSFCRSCCFEKNRQTRNLTKAVGACPVTDCDLWPYRSGKDVRHYTLRLSPEERKARIDAINGRAKKTVSEFHKQ